MSTREADVAGVSADGTVDLEAVQRRTLLVLFATSAFARGALAIVFAVSALLVEDILQSELWVGSALAVSTAGTAVSSSLLSSLMNRSGRRSGMVIGFSIALSGCLIAIVGGQASNVFVLLAGLFFIGAGNASANLARYAAADLAEPAKKGKAISSVVFASTIGAVGGPTLAGVSDRLGTSWGFEDLIGAYIFGGFLFGLAALMAWIFLRPDPLIVSGGIQTTGDPRSRSIAAGFSAIAKTSGARLALGGLVISTAVMVMVMAMTPVHIVGHGHDVDDVGWVIAAHTAGMFAFAPLAGLVSDTYGRRRALAAASVLLVLATSLTALAADAPLVLMFSGLFLLGLGWSFGFVSASALLSESVSEADAVSAQGAADLIAAGVSGVSALAAGFVVSMAGFHVLSMIGIVIAGLLAVLLLADRSNSAKGPQDDVGLTVS